MKDSYEVNSCRIPPSPSLYINKSLVPMPSGPFAISCFMYIEVCVCVAYVHIIVSLKILIHYFLVIFTK